LTFSINNIEPGSGYSRVHGFISLLAQDKSLSMKAAGANEIADVCLRILEAGMRAAGEVYSSFFDEYEKFRTELLSMPLTAESLMRLFNTRWIESI
jgi:hypothetical protein